MIRHEPQTGAARYSGIASAARPSASKKSAELSARSASDGLRVMAWRSNDSWDVKSLTLVILADGSVDCASRGCAMIRPPNAGTAGVSI